MKLFATLSLLPLTQGAYTYEANDAICGRIEDDGGIAVTIKDGTCDATAFAAGKMYFETKFKGLAFGKKSYTEYITNTTAGNMYVVGEYTKAGGETGIVKGAQTATLAGKAKVARAGVMLGSNTGAYGFAGHAAYVATADFKLKEIPFPIIRKGITGATSATEFKLEETEPFCISKWNGTTCGAERDVTTGDFKYSIFGYTAENSVGGWNNFVKDYAGFGLRNVVDFSSFGSDVKISFNGGTAASGSTPFSSTPASSDHHYFTGVKKLTLTKGTKSLDYEFPLDFNTGTYEEDATSKKMKHKDTPKTETITINAVCPKTAQSDTNAGCTKFYLDYLFPVGSNTLNQKGAYFIYDPTFKKPAATGASTTAPGGGAATDSSTSGAFGLGLSGVVMVFVGFLMM